MTSQLLFVESNTTMGGTYVHAARRLGVQPVLLSADARRYGFVPETHVEVVAADTGDRAAVARACAELAERAPLCGIMSTSDYYLEIAAATAQQFGLPGTPPGVIARTRNKHAQRRVLASAGIPSPNVRFCLTPQDVRRAHVTFPVVVKPVAGSGSVGVRLCRSRSELYDHADRLFAVRVNERGLHETPGILLEDYVRGPEYSAEVVAGRIVAIAAKHLGAPPAFVETGHDVPADLGAAREEAERTINRALDALELGLQPAHVEFRISDGTIVPIEVNPRVAGGCIPFLVALATGVDLVEQAVRLACGLPLDTEPKGGMPASVRFLMAPRDGAVTDVRGVARARAIPGVHEIALYCKRGDAVVRHGDFHDRVGHVIAACPTGAAARHAAEVARDTIELEVA